MANGKEHIDLCDDSNHAIASMISPDLKMAEKITRAVNEYDELVAALQAIRARLEGEFDHPALMAYGPLTTVTGDIGTIANAALAKAEPHPLRGHQDGYDADCPMCRGISKAEGR